MCFFFFVIKDSLHITQHPVILLLRLQELKIESQSAASTSASTPQPVNNNVHYLARALAQIEQGIERKFLKAPLGKTPPPPPVSWWYFEWKNCFIE